MIRTGAAEADVSWLLRLDPTIPIMQLPAIILLDLMNDHSSRSHTHTVLLQAQLRFQTCPEVIERYYRTLFRVWESNKKSAHCVKSFLDKKYPTFTTSSIYHCSDGWAWLHARCLGILLPVHWMTGINLFITWLKSKKDTRNVVRL